MRHSYYDKKPKVGKATGAKLAGAAFCANANNTNQQNRAQFVWRTMRKIN
jgi:hypothetical protein